MFTDLFHLIHSLEHDYREESGKQIHAVRMPPLCARRPSQRIQGSDPQELRDIEFAIGDRSRKTNGLDAWLWNGVVSRVHGSPLRRAKGRQNMQSACKKEIVGVQKTADEANVSSVCRLADATPIDAEGGPFLALSDSPRKSQLCATRSSGIARWLDSKSSHHCPHSLWRREKMTTPDLRAF